MNRTVLDILKDAIGDPSKGDEEMTPGEVAVMAIADELRTSNLLQAATYYANNRSNGGYERSQAYAALAAERLPR